MKYTFIKNTFLTVAAAGVLASCGSGTAIVLPTITDIDATPIKTTELTDDQAKNWKDLDLKTDTIPGMSVNKAYTEILNERPGKTTIVAVIDSGIDIEHEDLDGVIWVNEDEIPNNGIDDDKNGYIDDIHGWNFMGNIVDENLEYERIVRDQAMLPADIVAKAQKEYDEKLAQATQNKQRYEQILQRINDADKAIQGHLGKDTYTKEEVAAIETEDETVLQAKQTLTFFFSQGLESVAQAQEVLGDYINDAAGLLNGAKIKTNYREEAMPGNSPYTYNVGETWGDNQYSGPDPEKADAFHGTHVAGIIAAERDNGLGVNGVANNAKIMVLRAVSMGDEYDKDIAAAIRYAADNGAKVINGSFGKYHSSNPEFVWEAIKYAASKDVLFVNAAGNEGINTDKTQVYPQDQVLDGEEISDNFLTVGALAPEYGANMKAGFSNYGKATVDVFAPGVQIYSTAPLNEYRNASGTSMAAPAVAGVAAVIRSQFPKLSAGQVKQAIMDSGLTTQANVVVGESSEPFTGISKSGRMVNLYNALIIASQMK
jgi:subtilisin family serine protease